MRRFKEVLTAYVFRMCNKQISTFVSVSGRTRGNLRDRHPAFCPNSVFLVMYVSPMKYNTLKGLNTYL